MSFICLWMKDGFYIKGWANNLVLIQRPEGTWKWSIVSVFFFFLEGKECRHCHLTVLLFWREYFWWAALWWETIWSIFLITGLEIIRDCPSNLKHLYTVTIFLSLFSLSLLSFCKIHASSPSVHSLKFFFFLPRQSKHALMTPYKYF